MKRSGAALIAALCALISRISGAQVEMRVRPGEDVALYCDRVRSSGFHVAWFRNCSHHDQPSLVITHSTIFRNKFPRFSFVLNSSSGSYDLLVRSVREEDLGLYYCAVFESKFSVHVYSYGNRTTLLSLRETNSQSVTPSIVTPTPPGFDCSVCWKLLVSVCPVCVLLSSLLSSTCVYYTCSRRTTGGSTADHPGELKKVGGDELCYASLDLPSRGQKHLKKKRLETSDFSIYSEVRMEIIQSC